MSVKKIVPGVSTIINGRVKYLIWSDSVYTNAVLAVHAYDIPYLAHGKLGCAAQLLRMFMMTGR